MFAELNSSVAAERWASLASVWVKVKFLYIFPFCWGEALGSSSGGLPWPPEFFAGSKGKLGFVPAFFGRGWGGVSLSFLEIRQFSLAVGQWAGGGGLATLPPTSVSLSGCELVPKKPSIRGGLFTHTPSLPPAIEQGPQLFCGAWDFKLA